jgi:Na+-translocating ferredoxin:NAD+ oxidoreductase RnfG subunit
MITSKYIFRRKPLFRVNNKTLLFAEGLSENVKVEAAEVLKIKESTIVNDCFQHKSNLPVRKAGEEFGVFWQLTFRFLFAMMAMVITMAFHTYEELPKSVQKKLDKTIEALYPEQVIVKSGYPIESKYNEELKSLKIDNIYQLYLENEIVGYIILARADSKFDEFDYAVIYDQNISIKNVKILAYRENQGGEIGSKRWLKQFINKSAEDPIALYDDIQGISGATISCVSATEGVGEITRFMARVVK